MLVAKGSLLNENRAGVDEIRLITSTTSFTSPSSSSSSSKVWSWSFKELDGVRSLLKESLLPAKELLRPKGEAPDAKEGLTAERSC